MVIGHRAARRGARRHADGRGRGGRAHRGLGLIPGEVCPLADDLTDPALKVPHIGWNAMDIVPGREADPLFKYVKNGEYVYYVHSYYAKNCAASTLATSDYSIPVTGAVRQWLVYGTQFHPEKSDYSPLHQAIDGLPEKLREIGRAHV